MINFGICKGDDNLKVGLYDIINDPIPKLYKIKDLNISKGVMEYDSEIVNELNDNLLLDKLSSEHVYVLSLTYGNYPRGIVQLSIGKCDESSVDMRNLAIALLLTGAEQFMCFHNHPGGNKIISKSDMLLTDKFLDLGELLDIKFIRHLMITRNYYCECPPTNNKEIIYSG